MAWLHIGFAPTSIFGQDRPWADHRKIVRGSGFVVAPRSRSRTRPTVPSRHGAFIGGGAGLCQLLGRGLSAHDKVSPKASRVCRAELLHEVRNKARCIHSGIGFDQAEVGQQAFRLRRSRLRAEVGLAIRLSAWPTTNQAVWLLLRSLARDDQWRTHLLRPARPVTARTGCSNVSEFDGRSACTTSCQGWASSNGTCGHICRDYKRGPSGRAALAARLVPFQTATARRQRHGPKKAARLVKRRVVRRATAARVLAEYDGVLLPRSTAARFDDGGFSVSNAGCPRSAGTVFDIRSAAFAPPTVSTRCASRW